MIRRDGKCPNCVRFPPLLTSPLSTDQAVTRVLILGKWCLFIMLWFAAKVDLQNMLAITDVGQALSGSSQVVTCIWAPLSPVPTDMGWRVVVDCTVGTGVSEHMTHETRPVWAVPWQCSRQGWWLCPVLGTTVSGALNMQQHISWTHNIYKHWLSICDTYKLLGWHCDMWQHGLCPLAVSS